MMKKIMVLSTVLLLAIGYLQAQVISLSALHVIGHHRLTPTGDLELIGSAAHFSLYINGNITIKAFVPAGQKDGYLQYVSGKQKPVRLRIKAGDTTSFTIRNHRLDYELFTLSKCTEAKTGPVFISSLKGSAIPIEPAGEAVSIEFIGNSITCGAAADESMMPCSAGNYHDHHNAYDAYGPRVARRLKAGYWLTSVSGIGIYRNWNSNGPTMPQVYERLHLDADSTALRNFSALQPNIICIALGTNDFSKGDGKTPRASFDSVAYVKAYIGFIAQVRTHYPKASIQLLSSPMVKGENRLLFEACLKEIAMRASAARPDLPTVGVFFFKEMEARGCGGHPSVEDHGIMAEQLYPYLKQVADKLKP